MKPAQVGLGGRPAIAVFLEPRDRAVIDHLALLVAPAAINHLSPGDLVDVARDDAVQKFGRVWSADQVFVERGYVDQRRGIADGVVLVLMMHLVGADRIVSRPLAVVEAGAEGEG